MKNYQQKSRRTVSRFAIVAVIFTLSQLATFAADLTKVPVDRYGAPTRDASGRHLNYSGKQLERLAATQKKEATVMASPARPFGPTDSTQQPFWQYSIFGSDIGGSNIVIGPTPTNGSAPEILIGGSSSNGFGADDFWQSIRGNRQTRNYDQVFVSPLYPATIA